jgi:signal transduction histidine kinase
MDAGPTPRTTARIGSMLFLGTGLIALLTVPLPAPANLSRLGTSVVALAAIGCGLVTSVLPWQRWPQPATLVLVPLALALIAAGNAVGGSSFLTYGVFFIVVYVWIGMTQPRWVSVATTPLAAAAYLVPMWWLPVDDGIAVGATVLTVATCALVGETLAWGRVRLQTTEAQLREERDASLRLATLQRAQETWLSAASHELRTPIAICRGYLDVLPADAGRVEIAETIAVVIDELARMDRLVEDVATLARLQERSFVRRRPIALASFLADVAAKAEPLHAGRVRLAPVPEGAVVLADPDRLTQALLNLLGNAALHARSDVEVAARRERRAWRLEVRDFGGGLAAGTEEAAFSAFWRGSDGPPGRGLGLAVVRGVARAHRGEAGVDNRSGEGATFWIRLPG